MDTIPNPKWMPPSSPWTVPDRPLGVIDTMDTIPNLKWMPPSSPWTVPDRPLGVIDTIDGYYT